MRLQVNEGNGVLVSRSETAAGVALNRLSQRAIIGMIGASHIQIFGVISSGFPVS